ncbi:phosphomannomutase [Nilaparvata lugens]|uniref:phosphomannomutase n=1 Tax=Nilaparvata lugens TaxID=108931 RepID=UPI00193D4C2F|nr:phosphomannomutase [Nilaparvata lugens]
MGANDFCSKTVCLFDVDGTLTAPRQVITEDMKNNIVSLKKYCTVAVVGGSDMDKICEQLGGKEVLNALDYVFAENGLHAISRGEDLAIQSIQKHLGEEKLQKFINYCLHYMSELQIPVKRGTFIEFRKGMLNISPIGRNCSRQERNDFEIYDREHRIRQTFIDNLQKTFPDFNLKYSIGGQISFDVFPIGWDKTYCLQFLNSFEDIHFFGDKTDIGGNDYEIFIHSKTIGHSVTCPDDTVAHLKKLFPYL